MNKLNASGFTLIELMVGVAVLAIALGAGAPSMSEFIQNSRLAVQTNDLIASLHLARTEAIKRNARVTVCRSASGTTCNTTAGTGWEIGWIVFADAANFGIADAGEVVLDSRGVAANNVAIAPRAADTIDNFVSYTSRGVLRDSAGVAQSGVFRVCDERGIGHARGLVLSATGRVEFTRDPVALGACPP
ncbi:MAG: GspH/FimT family pseudopilin [Gammaproteobacteria bacterium]